jgi:hypothetical protein
MYRCIFKSATMNAQLVESKNDDYREKTVRKKNALYNSYLSSLVSKLQTLNIYNPHFT